MMRITVDLDKCEQNALCAAIAPTVFEISADDRLVVLTAEPGDELKREVVAAAAACPRLAITVNSD
jgi:ferredoxin